ncbi:MAG: NAD(P)H-dependent glycerol-3-phosphate dehydrogenase [Acutalibacteraceae bacterium]
MKATVIGCGRWGSFIAWYLDKVGHSTTLYGRESSKRFQEIRNTGTNGTVVFNDTVKFSSDLREAVESAEYIFISISAQKLRGLAYSLIKFDLSNKALILCMKGIEQSTGMRLTEIVADVLGDVKTAVWVGPGHVENFLNNIPNCMVIDSIDKNLIDTMINLLNSKLIRFYKGSDLIGTEIGAATKNVIGIAAGMLDGKGYSSLKGALMARAPREIAKLIECMGGNGISAYGLCHLGDYEATLFSQYSHNRMYGEALVKGNSFNELSEGVYTVCAVKNLYEKYNIDMPICKIVYDVIYEKADVLAQFDKLFMRTIKTEF